MDLKSLLSSGRSSTPVRIGPEADPIDSLRGKMDRRLKDFTRGWGLPEADSAFQSPRGAVAQTHRPERHRSACKLGFASSDSSQPSRGKVR